MNIEKKSKVTKSTIKTPQELVHIKHKISLRQYKVWVLLLRAYRVAYEGGAGPDENGFYHIAVSDLSAWIGYELVKGELRADLETIRKEPIIYNVLGKNGEKAMRGAGFISEWELSSNRLGFKLPGFLRDCIERLDLKSSIFQALNWSIFNSFTGKYEAVLYKLCKDYLGNGRTRPMAISDFRDYMGIREDEYTDFKRLNQWCISGPIKRINESEISDITIRADFRREARKIVAVQFFVTPKAQTVMDFGDDPAFRFARIAITLTQQREYLEGRSPELIELSIQRANEYALEEEKKGKDVNLGALYRKAIEEDWGKEFAVKKERVAEKERLREEKRAAERQAQQQRKLSELEGQFKKERAAEAIRALSANDRQVLAQSYVEEAGEGRAKSYRPETGEFGNSIERIQFTTWLRLRLVPEVDREAFATWLAANGHDPVALRV